MWAHVATREAVLQVKNSKKRRVLNVEKLSYQSDSSWGLSCDE